MLTPLKNKTMCIRVIKSLETSIQKIINVKLILIEIIINIEIEYNWSACVDHVIFGFIPGQHVVRR